MGSAFTPVNPRSSRGSSPMPSSGGVLHPMRPSKRTRQPQAQPNQNSYSRHHLSSSQQRLSVVEEASLDAPDQISTSASETSSRASLNSNGQPPLLDFIGATCMASAWFTSCFPCAVVDINDNDDYVVDKLSRESAMNVMYAKNTGGSAGTNNANNAYSAPYGDHGMVSPDKYPNQGGSTMGDDQNVIHVRLPEQTPQGDAPFYSVPSVIAEEDDTEDDSDDDDHMMDTISLNDEDHVGRLPIHPITPERRDSGILDDRGSPLLVEGTIPPKKKKKFGMKMFGRKKKA